VHYLHHGWDEVNKRVSTDDSYCTNYKVLDANTPLSDLGEFGVGDNPEWDKGGYK
jgi:hypothetical protein